MWKVQIQKTANEVIADLINSTILRENYVYIVRLRSYQSILLFKMFKNK